MRAPDRLSLVARGSLGGREAAWDELVAGTRLASPFLRSWWLDAVATRGACHLLVEDDGQLVGGVPLARDRWLGVTRYRFLGQGVLSPDHLDLVAAPGREEQVVEAFRSWFATPGVRFLDLAGLPADSLVHRAVGGRQRSIEVAPFEPLPASGADYLAARSANFRRSLRRSQRRLTEAGLVHRRIGPAGLRDALTAFVALHRARAGREQLLGQTATLGSAVAAGLARGEARVDVAEVAGQVAAVSVAFVTGRRLSCYQVARSVRPEHSNVATVLLARVIEDAIADGCRELDMLRGDEPYKAQFTGQRRELVGLRAGHGVPARGLVLARSVLTAARVRREQQRANREGSSARG